MLLIAHGMLSVPRIGGLMSGTWIVTHNTCSQGQSVYQRVDQGSSRLKSFQSVIQNTF